ncbi:MAG: HAD family hydrolase, partial [Cyanobacteria bacterium P01_A01_bin.3]
VNRPDVSLAYVTGRDLDSIQQAISNYDLPAPNYAIADVGASIFTHSDGEWTRLEEWDRQSANYCSKDRWSELDGLFDDLDCLELQEPAKQGLYKLSYYVPGEVNSTTLMVKLKTRLKWEEVQAKVIWSTDEHQKLGLVDILPANADKRLALEFLIDRYKFNRDRTLFAGVSANDTAVMASAIPAVLVANAGAEVKQLAYRRARESRNLETLYIARGGQLGMNGNYSAGIIEGVAYFFPEALS